MPGQSGAVQSGKALEKQIAELGRRLGLLVRTQVAVGRRIWGSKRFIDVVLTHPETRLSLGVECKYQGSSGTAEEKVPATIDDIEAWPIRGVVVYHGAGFSKNMVAYLLSTGKAIEFSDAENWLKLYFGL